MWELVQECADKGERCPDRDKFNCFLEKRGLPMSHRGVDLAALAREGKLRIEISALNYRVVEIAEGPHKGKRTQAPRTNAKPHLVIDKNGSHHTYRGRLRSTGALNHQRQTAFKESAAETHNDWRYS